MPALLFRTPDGPVARIDGHHYRIAPADWDDLLNRPDLEAALVASARSENAVAPPGQLLAPVGTQEVWAAGVTYFRSRTARMDESKEAGGGDFYDRVYAAERPELFMKATAHRVVAPGGKMHLRRDSSWMVPEPELALVINRTGTIIGYTVANDLSCRDIEGENPLYLPQAKVFDGCAALGPGLLITDTPLPTDTAIALEIRRDGKTVTSDQTSLSLLKRKPAELVQYLTRACSFPTGCFLMTGTGIVPADDFTLKPGDEVRITIEPIGTLVNTMG